MIAKVTEVEGQPFFPDAIPFLKGRLVSIRPAAMPDREPIYQWLAHSNLTQEMMGPPHFPHHPDGDRCAFGRKPVQPLRHRRFLRGDWVLYLPLRARIPHHRRHRLRAIQTTTASPMLQAAWMLLENNPKGVFLQSRIEPKPFLNGHFVTRIYGKV